MNEFEQKLAELKSSLEKGMDEKAKVIVLSEIKALEEKLKAFEAIGVDAKAAKDGVEELKTLVQKLQEDASENQKAVNALVVAGNRETVQQKNKTSVS